MSGRPHARGCRRHGSGSIPSPPSASLHLKPPVESSALTGWRLLQRPVQGPRYAAGLTAARRVGTTGNHPGPSRALAVPHRLERQSPARQRPTVGAHAVTGAGAQEGDLGSGHTHAAADDLDVILDLVAGIGEGSASAGHRSRGSCRYPAQLTRNGRCGGRGVAVGCELGVPDAVPTLAGRMPIRAPGSPDGAGVRASRGSVIRAPQVRETLQSRMPVAVPRWAVITRPCAHGCVVVGTDR